MRTPLFILAASLLLATGAHAQSKKQIRELKIKGMTETTTVYKDGKETATYKSESKTFDKDGNTTQDIEYNADGSVKRKETSKYSGKDKVEEIVERPNGGNANDNDDEGGPKKYRKTTWKYNANGDKTEEVEYDASGNVTHKTTYAYNGNGDRTFEVEYDGSGKLVKKIAYAYNPKGLRTEKKVFGPTGTLEKQITYTYTF